MCPFQVISTGLGIYHLKLLHSMDAVHPWFHTSFLKPAEPQAAGIPVLEDDFYEVEAILQIEMRRIHTKVM